jgi:putative FmdB family regulatory protein
MPLYEYRCEGCGHIFEVIQKFSDGPIAVCTSCGDGPVEKLPSSPAIQFKGTGWYITDYARKGQPGGSGTTGGNANSGNSESGSGDASAAKSSSNGGAGSTESKSDSRTETKPGSRTESKPDSKTAVSAPKKD